VLEAVASGLPVIAIPAGVRDHLNDAQNGIACTESDVPAMARAIVRLAGDYGLAQRLSRGARRTAEALDWGREVERLDESYREIRQRPALATSSRSNPREQLAG
jgi:glycosyltransferase involved in cell wall biosynthesis